jgi:hypothetical protein
MQFTPMLDKFLQVVDAMFEELGWDAPARLGELHLEIQDDSIGFKLVPLAELDGHPGCDLMRRRPVAAAEAVGAILITEGWSYSPANLDRLAAGEEIGYEPHDDPDRGEVRLTQLCLRDGTERTLQHRRGEAAGQVSDGPSKGLTPELLRRVVGCPSQAVAPPDGFARVLALAWQGYALIALAADGQVPDRVPEPEEWGRLVVPGSDFGASLWEPWWEPVNTALDGATLDVAALAAAFRETFARGRVPIPFLPPFARGEDSVKMSPELADWFDDAQLVAHCYDVTPGAGWFAGTIAGAVPPDQAPAWVESLRRSIEAQQQGR